MFSIGIDRCIVTDETAKVLVAIDDTDKQVRARGCYTKGATRKTSLLRMVRGAVTTVPQEALCLARLPLISSSSSNQTRRADSRRLISARSSSEGERADSMMHS
eukprot:3336695-Heterocapsa_arctica.AAC.1